MIMMSDLFHVGMLLFMLSFFVVLFGVSRNVSSKTENMSKQIKNLSDTLYSIEFYLSKTNLQSNEVKHNE